MTRTCLAFVLSALASTVLILTASSTPAFAQGGGAELGYRPNEGAGLLSDDQAAAEDTEEPAVVRDSTDPHEEDSQDYYFFGAFYRHSFIPSFIINLFTDEATPARNPGAGLEFTLRKAGFDIITSLYYQSFHVDGPFLAHNDPPGQVEFIESDLFTVMGGVTFLWSTPINDMFSIEYGMGLGLGVVGGSMRRTEAYPASGPGTVRGFAPCVAAGTPQPDAPFDSSRAAAGLGSAGAYCEPTSGATHSNDYTDHAGNVHNDVPTNVDGEHGAHYHTTARRWTDGGSVPNVYFRLALPHLALRFKPVHQFMMRIDGGFDVFSGFFVGGAMAYGF